MRRLLYLIAVGAFFLAAHGVSFGQGCASTAYTGFTCVSHAGSFTTSATTRNQTISVTVGDAVTFFGQALSTGSALTLTDSGACIGPLIGASTTAPTTPAIDIGAVTKATSTGTCTITMHWGGVGTTLVSSVQDWQGWNGAIDVSAAISSTTGTGTRSCPAVTTAQNGDLVLCMMGDTGNNGGTFTAGSGFAVTLGNNSMSQEAQVQSTAGSITPGFTYSQSSTFGVITFALESITVPPPPTFALSAINGIAPSGGVGGLNRWNNTYINPSTGFLGKFNGQATPSSAISVTNFVNFGGGTNGSEPANGDLVSSTFGTAGFAWVVTQIAAGMTYSNGTTFGTLPEPVLAGGTAYGNSGPLSIHCTSATDAAGTAHSCGAGTMSIPGAGPSVSAGFWFTTPNCNSGGTQDCGAMGIINGGTDYVNMHFNATGGACNQNGIFLEGHGGNSTGCLAYTNGAVYRVNGQENLAHAALTVTFSNGSPVLTAANSLAVNQPVRLSTTGSLPTNFVAAIPYFVVSAGLSGSQFEVAATQGGTAIVAGSAGSGTQTATQIDLLTVCQLNGFLPNGIPNLVLLGTLFATAETAASQPTNLQTGVSGEGPTITGFDFYWGGYAVDATGKISLTECIL